MSVHYVPTAPQGAKNIGTVSIPVNQPPIVAGSLLKLFSQAHQQALDVTLARASADQSLAQIVGAAGTFVFTLDSVTADPTGQGAIGVVSFYFVPKPLPSTLDP